MHQTYIYTHSYKHTYFKVGRDENELRGAVLGVHNAPEQLVDGPRDDAQLFHLLHIRRLVACQLTDICTNIWTLHRVRLPGRRLPVCVRIPNKPFHTRDQSVYLHARIVPLNPFITLSTTFSTIRNISA